MVRQAHPLARFLYAAQRRLLLCPLCLRVWEEAEATSVEIEIEHAPPRQYPGGAERCLTCSECNREAGDRFENDTARLNQRRRRAIEAAQPARCFTAGGLELPSQLPRFKPPDEALKLATVGSHERKLELKAAYLIAYATLGHSYILGPGLQVVRDLLFEDVDLTDHPICAMFDHLEPNQVYVVTEPTPQVIVTLESLHYRLSPKTHGVFLPAPHSHPDFYRRLEATRTLMPRQWMLSQQYDVPKPRRLPMTWDTKTDHPLRSRSTWTLDCDCLEGERTHEPFQIRLDEPRSDWQPLDVA